MATKTKTNRTSRPRTRRGGRKVASEDVTRRSPTNPKGRQPLPEPGDEGRGALTPYERDEEAELEE